jgi:amidophosphoribosyltransferase
MCGILFITRESPLERSVEESDAREMINLAFNGLLVTNNRGGDGGSGVALYTPRQTWKLHAERSAYDEKKLEFEETARLYERFMKGFDRLSLGSGTYPEAMLGHVRYSTKGEVNPANVHPIMAHYPKSENQLEEIKVGPKGVTLTMVVNGETWIQPEWEEQIKDVDIKGATSDSAKIAGMILKDYVKNKNLEKVLSDVYERIFDYGMIAAAGVLVDDETKKHYLFWMADGGRPLCEARINGYIMGISETNFPMTLKVQGRHDVKEIKQIKGGTIKIQDLETKEINEIRMDRVKPACFFEEQYFKRFNSQKSETKTVAAYRRRCGRCLAKEHPPPRGKNVAVAPVPQSGNSYAHGYSHQSHVHIEELIGRSPLSKEVRAFISNQNPDIRGEKSLLKFEPTVQDCVGKIIVVTDDSLVEGNNYGKVTYLLWRAGAAEVHWRIGCAPIVAPCGGGMYIPMTRPVAVRLGLDPGKIVEEHAELEEKLKNFEDPNPKIGTVKTNSVGYLSVKSLKNCLGKKKYCMGCVTRKYPYKFEGMKECGATFVPVKPRKKKEITSGKLEETRQKENCPAL